MTGTVLETGKRLSESILWRWQRRFFEEHGAQAWSDGTVPHYITSNGWIASAYAKLVFGWLRDCAGAGAPQPAFAPLDPHHPVHVVELGCGAGRFGYLFLNRLLDLLGRSSLRHVPIRYVFTDFTAGNLETLRNHPALQPLIADGSVDFALYDAEEDREIRLLVSGETLSAETLRNPLVAIANYVFDGIPHDVFTRRGGRLFEDLVEVALPEGAAPSDPEDPHLLRHAQVSWKEGSPVESPYGDPELDAILQEYARTLEDGTTLVFPCAALRCARNLSRLAAGRLLLLSGDKGYSREELLAGRGRPGLAVHGSFSLMVNHHALGRWVLHRGGMFLQTSHLHSRLNIVACLLGTPAGGTLETALAFEDAIERAGPDDFFDLKKSVEKDYEALSLEELLAWIRLSGWDSNIALGCFPALMKLAGSAPFLLRQEIHRMAHEVWKAYFPIGERWDLAFHLGALLCEIGCFEEALDLLHQSVALYGPNPATAFNMGLCHFHLGDLETARTLADWAIEAAPDFAPAVALREEIRQGETT